MNKAVFLDRDGVINADSGYVGKKEDFVFIDGIFEFLEKCQSLGYLLIIVTNQAGIARGYYSEDDFKKLDDWMKGVFLKKGIKIAKTYHCPFYPEHEDRKPNPGMILKAKDEFCIDLERSVLIGDKVSDIQAGRAAGVGKLVFLQGQYPFDFSKDTLYIKNLGGAEL